MQVRAFLKRRYLIVSLPVLAGLVLWWLIPLGAYYVGEARVHVTPLAPGALDVPIWDGPLSAALNPTPPLGEAFIARWTGIAGRNTLRSYAANQDFANQDIANQDIPNENALLRSVKVWAGSGSSWFLRPKADYDFFEIRLIAPLYLFGDKPDYLYPETVNYLVNTLLIEEGPTPRPMVPGSLGLVVETENHVLMTEGCRYLKNQWLFEHGKQEWRYDNAQNGLERWLLDYLTGIHEAGLYEFNSVIYADVTIGALLNLDAFAHSPEVSRLARHILDEINWHYALGSLDLRRCPPFRRKLREAGRTTFDDDPHTSFMAGWVSDRLENASTGYYSPAFVAAVLPYRLPDAVKQWVLHKPQDYFVRMGHGPDASPEIYSGGPGYLLSAGGVHRGWRSLIVARPTTLLLSDGAQDLDQCFRLPGQGDFTQWNNTGVYRRFACSNAPVRVPSGRTPVAQLGGWAVYAPGHPKGLLLAAFSQDDLGLLVLFPDSGDSPDGLARALGEANPDTALLHTRFTHPSGGVLTYDVNAPKGSWVIKTVDNQPVARHCDEWPRLDGDGPHITFDRSPQT